MILETPFDAPLRLTVPPSALMIVVPILWLILIFAMSKNIFTLATSGNIFDWISLILVLAPLAAAYYLIRLHYWQNLKSSILEINQDNLGQWSLRTNNGENDWKFVTLRSTSFVSKYLIVLNFQGEKSIHSVIFPATSLDKDTFRRLRVRVKVAFS